MKIAADMDMDVDVDMDMAMFIVMVMKYLVAPKALHVAIFCVWPKLANEASVRP